MSTAKKLDLPIDDMDLSSNDGSDLDQKMFMKISKKIYELAGVDLPHTPKNVALVRNRIVKVMRRRGLATYDDYWSVVSNNPTQADVDEFISALTTNMTSFFREANHFEWLADYLKNEHKKNSELRIWCAAASTGQEPYTLAMVCRENLDDATIGRTKILATDIDLQVLKKGAIGKYNEREISGLPSWLEKKYFSKIKHPKGDLLKAEEAIHSLLTFAPFNLMSPKYEMKTKFDIIFCRNVLIYFNEEDTKRVINNLVSCVRPGGYLVLGHSESGNVRHNNLKPLSRAIYQKV